jgi:hypothetical protein
MNPAPHRWRLALLLSSLLSGLAGCNTLVVVPPSTDLTYFEPLPLNQRIMDSAKINWQPREDVHTLCSRITGIPITPYSLPMACAYWNVVRKECTVITGREYGVNYLGHEVRHCFEGNFHP